MCLAIPSQVVEIDEKTKTAVVDTLGVKRRVSLMMMHEPVEVGDWVLIHVGFAIEKIDEEEAQKTLELFKQLIPEELEEETAQENNKGKNDR
jgi:hydrogenase expression/formation protein HypC